ncbi:MAG: diacylglycerol kinase family lipid kinase [Bacteroidales bacterium]|nr:diacylglycerol kinase family lipid kinase [Bacteroidales bacterium]
MKDPSTHPVKKIVFIVNPISGSGKKSDIAKVIGRYLDASRYSSSVFFTETRGHATRLARDAAEAGANVVVAVGGDGTVNEVGKGIVGTETAIAIIPTGSGNGLARHLRLPLNYRRAIGIINRGKRETIDTATMNGAFFVNVAGVGFDAHVARKFEKAEKRGFLSYFSISTSAYNRYKPKKYTLIIDGITYKRRALMISFANSSQFGNNTTIAPKATLNDGLIDVCILKKLPFWKITLLSPLVFTKQFDKTPYLEIIQGREVIVKRKKGRYIHLDGDPQEEGKTFAVIVHPLSLQVIVP